MSKEKNKSSISINLFLNEAMTEKVVIIFLTFLASFSSGFVYGNQQSQLPQTPPVEIVDDTVK